MVVPINNTESLAFGIANAASLSSRPNFELAFSVLQNTVIDRINKEIEKANEQPVNDIDTFLLLEHTRLNRVLPFVQQYQVDNNSNRFRAAKILDNLDILDIDVLLADAADFDRVLAETNRLAQEFLLVNGSAFGIVALDGFQQISTQGLGINAYATYANDAARQAAIESARTRVRNAQTIANLNAETVFDFRLRTERDIVKLSTQIEATRALSQAEKAAEIDKLRQQYGQVLNTISLAFESAQARSEAILNGLLASKEPKVGTILRLFA
jgi:hypothetical protein